MLSRFSAGRRPPHPLLAPVGVLAVAVCGLVYVGSVDPNQRGHYPTCPFLALTGLYCPGCGSLRMFHALAHGHLGEAIGHNAFAVAMLPVLAFFWIRWTLARAQGRPTRTKAGDPRLIWALFAAVMVFWILRNLPFGQVLAP
jgi:rubredoxin